MSDTSPVNQERLRHGAGPTPARVAQPGEPLFAFVRARDQVRFHCELRDCGPWGTEAQFYRNEEFVQGHRFPTRELATTWAEAERAALERDA